MTTPAEHSEAPPALTEPVNPVELDSIKDGKISTVSVYNGRAEVTRLFQFEVKTGQNLVHISGLPTVLDVDSLRVEGRGSATIHDVTISEISPQPIPTVSDTLKDLTAQQTKLEKALARNNKALKALEQYLESVKANVLPPAQLKDLVDSYETTAASLDDQITRVEAELSETNKAIEKEKKKLAAPNDNPKLRRKASIGVFAAKEGLVKISLIYAVKNARWDATYDIRVDMQTKDKPVSLIYKGAITQSTGEDWTDVSIALETAAPTFGLEIPTLTPWTLSLYRPAMFKSKSKSMARRVNTFGLAGAAPSQSLDAAALRSPYAPASDEEYDTEFNVRQMDVSSSGNITATFSIPGLMSIPSDNAAHNVTIAKLELDAKMNWVAVPKVDTKVHLNAKIKNSSQFTFLPGPSSVYVDGSFISKSFVPGVSPEESFDCPLGVDPTIRITYHPRNKKISQSGFFSLSSKTTTHTFTQRLTIFNTKTSVVDDVKIIDQLPVSEDSQVTVKWEQPALIVPGTETTASAQLKVPPPLKVANGVTASWYGADEPGVDLEALGADGKFNWVCSIGAQAKINLTMQWEVTAPVRSTLMGL